MPKRKKSLGQEVIDALQEFTELLESGTPIEATRITRIQTPDGPMHLHQPIVIQGRNNTMNMDGVYQIESVVANPRFRLFVDANGKYGYSIDNTPIIWCDSRAEAEQQGKNT